MIDIDSNKKQYDKICILKYIKQYDKKIYFFGENGTMSTFLG